MNLRKYNSYFYYVQQITTKKKSKTKFINYFLLYQISFKGKTSNIHGNNAIGFGRKNGRNNGICSLPTRERLK